MRSEPLHPYDHSCGMFDDTSCDTSGCAIVHLLNGSLSTNNPFVTTLEAVRRGAYVSGYLYNPDGTAWTPTDRDKGFLPPLTVDELHHYLPQPQFGDSCPLPPAAAANPLPSPQPQQAPWTNMDWIRQSSAFTRQYPQPQPTSFIPTAPGLGLFARYAAAQPHHRHQHQDHQRDQFLDHSSLAGLQATTPSPLSQIQDLSSPVKPPDTPTPAPRVPHQRSSSSRSGKHLVEMEEGDDHDDAEEENESSCDQSTPEDSADEDYKPSHQKRVKKMTAAVRRSSRRTRGFKPGF